MQLKDAHKYAAVSDASIYAHLWAWLLTFLLRSKGPFEHLAGFAIEIKANIFWRIFVEFGFLRKFREQIFFCKEKFQIFLIFCETKYKYILENTKIKTVHLNSILPNSQEPQQEMQRTIHQSAVSDNRIEGYH